VTLGKRLKQVMEEHRPPITQHALAAMVGVTQPAVAGWLEGAIPYARTVNKICSVLGVRRDWLLYGEGKKYLPKAPRAQPLREDAPEYNVREKITLIEEQKPELIPLIDAFLDTLQKQPLPGAIRGKPARKTR